MKKIKIFDTNVLLSDPNALFNYPSELVVIPISVIEEIDEFKKSMNEVGKNARYILRKIDKLRKRGKISAKNKVSKRAKKELLGIPLNNNGRLIIELNHTNEVPQDLNADKVDNRILAVALWYTKQYPKSEVQLITQDANLRIKADAYGIVAKEYEKVSDIHTDLFYKGFSDITLNDKDYELLQHQNFLYVDKELQKNPLIANQYLTISHPEFEQKILCRYDKEKNQLVKLEKKATKELSEKWIRPINEEQQMAIDALLNPAIPLVTITGKAGTGKTLLAIAAGLYQTCETDIYDKILIARPVIPMGKDIGYLPGTVDEKLNPWMQPIFDNLEFLFENNGNKKNSLGPKFTSSSKKGSFTSHADLMTNNILKVEPLTYIRGRSIPNQFIIIDEAQNLSLHEIKTIITRAGKGTKIVFTGDPEQIDNPYVDSISNGLTQIVERLKNERLTAHINLEKGERSELAEIAAELLK